PCTVVSITRRSPFQVALAVASPFEVGMVVADPSSLNAVLVSPLPTENVLASMAITTGAGAPPRPRPPPPPAHQAPAPPRRGAVGISAHGLFRIERPRAGEVAALSGQAHRPEGADGDGHYRY